MYVLTVVRCIPGFKLEHAHNGFQALDLGKRLFELLFIVVFKLKQFLEMTQKCISFGQTRKIYTVVGSIESISIICSSADKILDPHLVLAKGKVPFPAHSPQTFIIEQNYPTTLYYNTLLSETLNNP